MSTDERRELRLRKNEEMRETNRLRDEKNQRKPKPTMEGYRLGGQGPIDLELEK